ncbi:MAG: hypothetical protein M5E90_04675, partial [Asgard group archaeon]|nr:hypothetical protein [Asgard group archaeon]
TTPATTKETSVTSSLTPELPVASTVNVESVETVATCPEGGCAESRQPTPIVPVGSGVETGTVVPPATTLEEHTIAAQSSSVAGVPVSSGSISGPLPSAQVTTFEGAASNNNKPPMYALGLVALLYFI